MSRSLVELLLVMAACIGAWDVVLVILGPAGFPVAVVAALGIGYGGYGVLTNRGYWHR